MTVAPVLPDMPSAPDEAGADGDRDVEDAPARRRERAAGGPDPAAPGTGAGADGDGSSGVDALVDGLSPRRLARALSDPAILLRALLAQSQRLREIAGTPVTVATFVRERVGADAVDVVVADGSSWRTHVTVGWAEGAGGVCDVVDVPGLVAWLESFETPVVLDGSDLGSPGSWVLAAPTRGARSSTALILAWRGPGGSVFEPAAVSLIGEVAADAAPSVELAVQLGQLARAVLPDGGDPRS